MEYGMNATLKIHMIDLHTDILESIEFIFKQENKNEAPAIKYEVWVNGQESERVYILDDDLEYFYIPFTKEETFDFKPGKNFYVDARIHYTDTFDNPKVPVVPVMMDTGLFGKVDESL